MIIHVGVKPEGDVYRYNYVNNIWLYHYIRGCGRSLWAAWGRVYKVLLLYIIYNYIMI